jgi:hypothetical protein
MRTKRGFVPESLGKLEDRAVPAPTFFNGVAVLTTGVYWRAVQNIEKSFHIYGNNLNAGQLANNLLRSVYTIPYNRASGLDNQLLAIAFQTQTNVFNGVPNPLIGGQAAALNALNNSVINLFQTGNILIF